ncbi:hypothetical protein JCM10213_004583 [Rhodosporidiobolus nylandii]
MLLSFLPSKARPRQLLTLALAIFVLLSCVALRSKLAAPPPHLLVKRQALADHDEGHGDESSDALIDWLALYQAARPGAPRAALFALMVLWLVFLFAFVGICASEFFCPNLSHIASRLGLSESVAGVTFLAFSNGSPDVFSTFAALKSDSGSLAIGELIGAASFIVSVVAGSMALITPFRVARSTFLRDVGFFTLAVLLTLGILYDSHIHLWEALLMVGLYLVYVIVVGVGSWWENRREKERARMREVRGEYDHETDAFEGEIEWETEGALALPSGASTPQSSRSRSYRSPSPAFSSSTIIYHPESEPTSPGLNRTRSTSVASSLRSPLTPSQRPPPTPLIGQRRRSRSVRPSLLGAIEFRDVVNSLSSERGSAANVLAVFGGAHQHHEHSHDVLEEAEVENEDGSRREETAVGLGFGGGREAQGRRRALSQPTAPGALRLGGEDDALAEGVLRGREQKQGRIPLGGRRTTWQAGGDSESETEGEVGRKKSALVDLSEGVENPWESARSSFEQDEERTEVHRVPSILLTTDSGADTILAEGPSSDPASQHPHSTAPSSSRGPSRRRQRHHLFRALRRALFPSLQSFRSKSILGRVTALICVPALFVLNLTLPVVEEPSDEDAASWAAGEKKTASTANGDFCGMAGDTTPLAELEDPIERVGRQLHSPAIDMHRHAHPQHGHDHTISHSHHLQHVRAAAVEAEGSSRAWSDVSTTPLDSPNHPSAPLEYFRIVNASEGSEASRVPETRAPSEAAQEEQENWDDEELEVKATNQVTRVLTALQCAIGPVFAVCALFADSLEWYEPLASAAIGLLFAALAYRFFESPSHPGRVTLCFLGFFIAMVWILMIVNEVVGVLLTIGHIFGISDAILGLTIFAMGNSLGDLVANATVARMGYPSMAIAACFGGPMLNILLGVGLSGTYLIVFDSPSDSPNQPLHIDMGRTLLVSGIGLFAILAGTLVVVPLNRFRMSKPVGAALIAAYSVVLCVNLAVELL